MRHSIAVTVFAASALAAGAAQADFGIASRHAQRVQSAYEPRLCVSIELTDLQVQRFGYAFYRVSITTPLLPWVGAPIDIPKAKQVTTTGTSIRNVTMEEVEQKLRATGLPICEGEPPPSMPPI